jgi:cytoskeletal protein RodZ
MDTQDFGTYLRRAREARHVSVPELARKTRMAPATLELLEAGSLGDLPPEVFVRGFIKSYTRALGIPDAEPLSLFGRALEARRRAEEALITKPVVPAAATNDNALAGDEEGLPQRRGIGLAVFVIILLLIATITLSLYLRQPPQSGEGLSQGDAPALHVAQGPGSGGRPPQGC